jgi:succinate dehydrogenase flavin-adding protein (antitoxin of CptAB toxin-antitoxin module)
MALPFDGRNRRPKEDRGDATDMVKMKARLLYQSRKRGIKENDLIMGTFAHKFMDDFDLDQYVSLPSPR